MVVIPRRAILLSHEGLLFDECFGRPSIDRLSQLVSVDKAEKPEIRHIFDFAPSGTFDEVWIPNLATQGWTVITSDRGSQPNRNRGEKLPRLCARYAITHILLSPTVHGRTSFEKLLTVLDVWYDLLGIASDPAQRGKRYVLEPMSNLERGRGRLTERAIKSDLIALRDEYLKSIGEDPPLPKPN